MPLETDLKELKRLRRTRKLFATPAALYEEISNECQGECEEPRMIGPMLTCCACKLLHDLVVDASKLEKVVRERIERDTGHTPRANLRQATREGLALKSLKPRTHSPTHVGRMKGDEQERLRLLREQFKDVDAKDKPKKH